MARDDSQLVLLDPSCSKIGYPEDRFGMNMPVQDVLEVVAKQLYSANAFIRPSCVEELANTSKCLKVKKGAYVKIIAKLKIIDIF